MTNFRQTLTAILCHDFSKNLEHKKTNFGLVDETFTKVLEMPLVCYKGPSVVRSKHLSISY
jgi:hypothetical protein